MRLLVNVLVLTAAMTLAAGCGSPAAPAPAAPETLSRAGLAYYWQSDIAKYVAFEPGEAVTNLYKVGSLDRDTNLYATTNRGRLICYDARVGTLKWSHKLGDAHNLLFRPVHADRVDLAAKPVSASGIVEPGTVENLPSFSAVVINTPSRVVVINRDSGEMIRDIKLAVTADTAGASDGKMFYYAAPNGTCYLVRLQEAVEQPAFSPDVPVYAGLEMWNGLFYLAAGNGQFYCRRSTPTFSEPNWRRELSGPVRPRKAGISSFVVESRGLFIPTLDKRVYALNPASGKDLWPNKVFTTQGPLQTPIQVGADSLFQYASGDALYAIDIAKGEQRWSNAEGHLVVGQLDTDVAVLARTNTVMLVDEALGTVRQSVALSGYDIFAPNATSSAIWACNAQGQLACIRKASAGYLKVSDIASQPATTPAGSAE